MTRIPRWAPAAGLLACLGAPARADVWDVQSQSDNTPASENELVHGSDQVHDLGALAGPTADEDWYRLRQQPFSSYEALVEPASADGAGRWELQRWRFSGAILGQDAVGVGTQHARSLRFRNTQSTPVDHEQIRVRSSACSTDCTSESVYRLRFRETTAAIPRFNNAGSQATVLILHNPNPGPVTGAIYFWSTSGVLMGPLMPLTLPRNGAFVVNTSTVGALAGQTGSITIAHDAPYGTLSGKAVAIEPATGYSFDSPLIHRAQ